MKKQWTITKQIAKLTIDMYLINGYEKSEIKASRVEYEVSKYVDNMHCDDRQKLQDYIESLLAE